MVLVCMTQTHLHLIGTAKNKQPQGITAVLNSFTWTVDETAPDDLGHLAGEIESILGFDPRPALGSH
jgi:hypothetical protein